jgi:hypothetical protein
MTYDTDDTDTIEESELVTIRYSPGLEGTLILEWMRQDLLDVNIRPR